MARIETTIWDFAMAVGEQADAGTDDRDEAFDLAFCALANLLHNAPARSCAGVPRRPGRTRPARRELVPYGCPKGGDSVYCEACIASYSRPSSSWAPWLVPRRARRTRPNANSTVTATQDRPVAPAAAVSLAAAMGAAAPQERSVTARVSAWAREPSAGETPIAARTRAASRGSASPTRAASPGPA